MKRYPIVDLAAVYDKGARGRTMSGRDSNWLLAKVREAGVKAITPDELATLGGSGLWGRVHQAKEAFV